MKVIFLRNYNGYKISEVVELELTKEEKKYLVDSGTIMILEDENEISEEIPKITVSNGKNTKKGKIDKNE